MKFVDINSEIFKEYDIRGKYPSQIDRDVAWTIGKGYGSYLFKIGKKKCIVGYDNRHSSLELSLALTFGILSSGIDVISVGMVTTPMCLYAKEVLKCPSYIMVTASHNPKDENGFKFSFDERGNVRSEEMLRFRDFVSEKKFVSGVGKISKYNIKPDYINLFEKGINLGDKKIKVVLDLANGTTSCIARRLFEMFPQIDLTIINEESNPDFPNHHPNPSVRENQKQLQYKVLETQSDIGIGFDGDGDRCAVVDNKGNIVSADQFIAIMCKDIINNNSDKRILYDVECSNLVKDEIVKWGGDPVVYRKGASFVMSKVIDEGILFGGEFSGHFFFNDRIPVIGSGIYASLRMIELLTKTDKTLSDLLASLNKYFSSDEMLFKCSNVDKFNVLENIKKYCINMRFNVDMTDGIKIFKNKGWALIRASNTTPNIIARFEGNNEEDLFYIKREFINLINYYNK